jgi:hypothetical protein
MESIVLLTIVYQFCSVDLDVGCYYASALIAETAQNKDHKPFC